MAERPKLAMRCKAEEEKGTVGLTEQPKCWRTRAPNLIPGSKHTSESPAMVEGSDQRRRESPLPVGSELGEGGSAQGGEGGRRATPFSQHR